MAAKKRGGRTGLDAAGHDRHPVLEVREEELRLVALGFTVLNRLAPEQIVELDLKTPTNSHELLQVESVDTRGIMEGAVSPHRLVRRDAVLVLRALGTDPEVHVEEEGLGHAGRVFVGV